MKYTPRLWEKVPATKGFNTRMAALLLLDGCVMLTVASVVAIPTILYFDRLMNPTINKS